VRSLYKYWSRPNNRTKVKLVIWLERHWVIFCKLRVSCVGIEILAVVIMKISASWDIAPRPPLKANRRFGRTHTSYLGLSPSDEYVFFHGIPKDRNLQIAWTNKQTNNVPNFAGCRVVSAADPLRPQSRFSRPEPLPFLSSSSSVVLTRLSGPRSRPITSQKSW
jgi:hypothetical protein